VTKKELIKLLISRTDIPDDAEIRVVRPKDIEQSSNVPARGIGYDAIGPLHYVEIV
jgi:hypothetical protein